LDPIRLVEKRIVRIGHRGAAGHAPENTIAALRKGIALGVDFVEFDVQRSQDGRLIVMHDRLVDRTTNGTGLISQMTWEELRSLDAGYGESVPSLEDALAAANGQVGVMLEAKAPGVGPAMRRAVQKTGFDGPLVYSSFLHAEILAIREVDPRARTMALLEGIPVAGAAFACEAGATLVGLAIDFATADFVALLHDAGLEVWVYTVNDPRLIERAIELGVEGIISDFPERVPKVCPVL
jgi:glycerophosphoryl diester phosphodiesterase